MEIVLLNGRRREACPWWHGLVSLGVASIMIYFLLWYTAILPSLEIPPTRETPNRTTRALKDLESEWMEHPDPPHPFATNMWWRYANYTAKSRNMSDCYVCSKLPHSSSAQHLTPVPFDHGSPNWGSETTDKVTDTPRRYKSLRYKCAMDTMCREPVEGNTNVIQECESYQEFHSSVVTLNNSFLASVRVPADFRPSHCYLGNGKVNVGIFSPEKCGEILSPCTMTYDSDCDLCPLSVVISKGARMYSEWYFRQWLPDRLNKGNSKNESQLNPSRPPRSSDREFAALDKGAKPASTVTFARPPHDCDRYAVSHRRRSDKTKYCDGAKLDSSQAAEICSTNATQIKSRCEYSLLAPGRTGTVPIPDVHWLCGSLLYIYLPANWRGVCTPVSVRDETYIISAQDMPHIRRKRGESDRDGPFEPHDGIWGSDVPDDFKLWSTGSKVLLSLFPWDGVGKLMLRVETINYRFMSFLNASIFEGRAVREELRGLRLTVLQNRMVLDQLTAPQGGVCVIVGSSCCTYIPADDEDGGKIPEALNKLSKLQQVMMKDAVQDSDNLFSFLKGWKQWFIMIGVYIAVFVVLCGICSVCIVPCAKAAVTRVTETAVGITAVQLHETTPDVYDDPDLLFPPPPDCEEDDMTESEEDSALEYPV